MQTARNRIRLHEQCEGATPINTKDSSATSVSGGHLGRGHLGGFGVAGRIPARFCLALWP